MLIFKVKPQYNAEESENISKEVSAKHRLVNIELSWTHLYLKVKESELCPSIWPASAVNLQERMTLYLKPSVEFTCLQVYPHKRENHPHKYILKRGNPPYGRNNTYSSA
jgi:hypothetical protein